MDSIIEKEMVTALLGKPPSLNLRPNFFNLRKLQTHFARALNKLPSPQLAVNGWSGAAMSPPIYALVDETPFDFNISLAPDVADLPPMYAENGIAVIPY